MDQRTADRVLSELAHLREMLSSKSKKALKMPDGIQRAVRQVIRKLKEDVENPLVVDYEKFENNDIRTIVGEVRRSYTNYDWGSGTIEEALRRVWKNMHNEERRREKGKKELHRRQSKQAKRIRDKLKSRCTQLKNDAIYKKKDRKKIRKCLTKEATSPELMHTKKPETLKEEVVRSFQCPMTISELGRINSLNVRERVSVKGEVTKIVDTEEDFSGTVNGVSFDESNLSILVDEDFMSCSSEQLQELFPESTFVENVKVRGTRRRSIIMSM
uniref:Uncharacterized protein n=1 Tax=Magallana gigas TaxID=29159 RepID=K1QY76_MAGGI